MLFSANQDMPSIVKPASPAHEAPVNPEPLEADELRVLFSDRALVDALEDAVQPYHFNLSLNADGIARLVGDRSATTIVRKAAKSWAQSSAVTDRQSFVANVVADTLKRELAFRLNGLVHAIRPLSMGQAAFMQTLLALDHSLVLGLGPTGTGKTHLAVAAALSLLADGKVHRLIFTRPHVLATGEVMTPQMRAQTELDPNFAVFDDILRALLGEERTEAMIASKAIELIPLGRMRGRTFNDAFILVDEAQNMTESLTRMAVTRLGQGSRLVMVGDLEQVDLTGDERSGLASLVEMVEGRDLASIHRFTRAEIIRNPLVAQLEKLYATRAA